uniref:Uncharacterized protein n=1 Tax=viral metagenome TaxID=1070528 RepID=A0A6M3KCU3_9ZZZZ
MKKLMVLFWYLVYAPEFWLIRRRIKRKIKAELKEHGFSEKGADDAMRSIKRGMEDVKVGRVSKIDMEEL